MISNSQFCLSVSYQCPALPSPSFLSFLPPTLAMHCLDPAQNLSH